MDTPVPSNEAARLEALREYQILDTAPEQEFDDLTGLAAQLCATPMAYISFVDDARQWLKSRLGVTVCETPRTEAFCAHAILGSDLFVIPDAHNDARFAANPLVTGAPHIRFYAGAPLVAPGGHRLGALCVIDRAPRELDPAQRQALQALGRQVVRLLELRHNSNRLMHAVTDLSRAEQELRHSHEQLEQRVRQRTAELNDANRAMYEEILRHRQTLTLLRQSEERQRIFAGMTSDYVYVYQFQPDGQLRLEWMSDSFHRVSGYTPAELIAMGDATQALVHPDDWPVARANFERLLAGEASVIELRAKRKSGEYYWVRNISRPGRDERTGQVNVIYGAAQDISEEKAGAELRQQKEAAEAASRAKSDFLATMSHEMRTPLNGVLGMVELLEGTRLDAGQQADLGQLRECAETLLAVINDVLDLSKIEAGRLELEAIPCDVRDCVRQTLGAQAARAQQKGLALRWEVAPEVPASVIGDPFRLRQVLLNLVANAIKFTERGEVTVRIAVADDAVDDDHVTLTFSVQDTGIGIAPHQQEGIFHAFHQADSSTSRRYGGSGLGLTICRRLVEKMDGRIGVESEPGRGSTFSFTVRLRRAGAAPPRPAVVPPGPTPAGLSILVVEDNPVNQRLAARLLEKQGHAVVVASSGAEALNVLDRAAVDVVLMDVEMPDMDGCATTAAIRQREQGSARHVPILALTAHALKGDRDRCLAAGMDGYLAKPIQWPELFAAINQVVTPGERGALAP